MGTVFKMTRTGTIQTLASFSGTNGNSPQGGLILGSDGCLYGTTHSGGPANDGVIFKMTPLGVLTALTSFNGANGQYPNGRLVIGNDGCFYGTTLFGGSGSGTIFKVNLSGTLTTLVSFSGSNGFPIAGLVLGTDGNFYGACSGTIFKMTPSGGISTFATFTDPNIWGVCDGLAQGKDGNFYGTTRLGGSNDDGTVFTVSPSGVLTTLFSFNGTNGGQPCSGLIQGNDGNLYGTTESGGQGDGTVFMISPGGSLTTLVSFDGTNGGAPQASLLLGSDGDLYGTTNWGGLNGLGNVFQIVLQAAGQPVFSPSAGTFIGSQSVAISSPTPSASIRYTTDGTVPSETNGVVYSSPVLLSQPCRLQAIACLAGEADSPVTSGLYDVVPPAATPAFSAGSGTYWGGQTITISSATPGAVIRYTLDGSLPSESAGYLYTSPLQIGTSMSINAIAYRVGCLDSGIASASYTIVAPAAAPTFSTAPGGQSVAISCATVGASIRYTLDGSTPSETNGITYVGPVNITVPTTIKAIAYGVGFSDSVVSVVAVGIPTISITTPANGGTVNN
jgi:uncharacterized repeat protein (TIGR03803 family)